MYVLNEKNYFILIIIIIIIISIISYDYFNLKIKSSYIKAYNELNKTESIHLLTFTKEEARNFVLKTKSMNVEQLIKLEKKAMESRKNTTEVQYFIQKYGEKEDLSYFKNSSKFKQYNN
jgi:hypothetical protein